jgi:hypothetical protein
MEESTLPEHQEPYKSMKGRLVEVDKDEFDKWADKQMIVTAGTEGWQAALKLGENLRDMAWIAGGYWCMIDGWTSEGDMHYAYVEPLVEINLPPTVSSRVKVPITSLKLAP